MVDCSNKSGKVKGVSFHRVPPVVTTKGEFMEELTRERRRRWISAISREGLSESILENDRVCGRHFISGKPAQDWDRHNDDWVPTLHLGHRKQGPRDSKAKNERAQRAAEKRRRDLSRIDQEKQQVEAKVKKLNESGEPIRIISFSQEDKEMMNTNTGSEDFDSLAGSDSFLPAMPDMSLNEKYDDDQNNANSKHDAVTQTEEFDYIYAMKNMTIRPFDESYFAEDDAKVRFYTGLPSFDILKKIFNFVAPHVKRNSLNLSKFQEFIMTLIKVRLNVPHQDLAYRFDVSLTTVSCILTHWLMVMDIRLSCLISWPEREDLWRTMPQCFPYSFGKKVNVIIDCFEVFIDRPTNLMARAQTFSNYKHHNTAKILIGITPQGTISFVSEAWGGRTSDKFLTENCGILKNLLPGDLILADYGFTVHESVWYYGAHLNIPAFTRGKDQLDPVDVETTRGIANVRIHVERVIGTLRQKYTILQSTLPTDFLTSNINGPPEKQVPLLDRIVRVCSALVNLCPPIIAFD